MRNSDALWLCFAAVLMLGGVVSGQEERAPLISKGQAGWRYLDTGKAPPAAWIQADFDDSRWKEGRAPLGYGEEDIATQLDFGGDAESKSPVAFFRLKFNVEETAATYAGRIRADDGAVIYLNGKEIHRLRMPEGTVDHDDYTAETLSSGVEFEGDFLLFGIAPERVGKGENVLCVSVHQSSGRSSDLILDVELLGLSKEGLAQLEEKVRTNRAARERQLEARRRGRDEDNAAGAARLAIFVKQQMNALIPKVGDSLARRYGLNEDAREKLEESVRESVDAMLEKPEEASALGTLVRLNYGKSGSVLLDALLSQPDSKAALAKHLGEDQLRDYVEFTKARVRRDQQAVDRQLTAWLDQQLSLTAEQRRKIEDLMATSESRERQTNAREREARVFALDMLWVDSRGQARLARQRFVPRADGLLTPKQSEVWQLLTSDESRSRRGVAAVDEDELKKAEARIKADVRAGRITREEAGEKLEGLKLQLGGKDERAGAVELEEREKSLAQAKLAAHTEQLGPLDARASKRLALVSKGVVERYLESHAASEREEREAEYKKAAGQLRRLLAAGRITREQMAARLEGMKERWGDEEERTSGGSGRDITESPLYQAQIEKVLSDDAYARYKTRQSARLAYRQKALRDLVVASMDTTLLLGEKQRRNFEETAAKLRVPPATRDVSPAERLLARLYDGVDRQALSSWQQEQFGGYAAKGRDPTRDEDVDPGAPRRRRADRE